LKKVTESYWRDEIDQTKLVDSISSLKVVNWINQKNAGIDQVPSNDFSLYDQVLDTALLVGAIPDRYMDLYRAEEDRIHSYPVDTCFAMARGLQDGDHDIPARLASLHALTALDSGAEHDLTDTQREALLLAYERGYYQSPREVSLDELAAEVGITGQSFGSRLRRGIHRLIGSTLASSSDCQPL
jgi:hypothetical protein